MEAERDREGLVGQVGVWNWMASIYLCEIDRHFVSVVEYVIPRAELESGQ